MVSEIDTDRNWPPPLPIGVLALRVLQAKIDNPAWVEDPPGSNQGEVVRWACQRWMSPGDFAEAYRKGDLFWCAGAVCSAFIEAGSTTIKSVASLSCDLLWVKIATAGHLIVPPGQEQPGDIYFLGRAGNLSHVGLIEVPGDPLVTVSGNSPKRGRRTPADRVERHRSPRSSVIHIARLSS